MKERIEQMKNSKKKGFTLIELVVVIAILAILALIMVPNLTAYLDKAKEAKIKANMKNVHTAAEMVRQTERGLDIEKVKRYSNIENIEKNENPVELTYTVFENEDKQVIVQYKDNKGKIHTFPKEFGNLSGGDNGEGQIANPDYGNEYLATDNDFTWTNSSVGYTATNETSKGYYKYTGEAEIVKIPHEIHGHSMTSYYRMFAETSVEKVISDNSNVTNMSGMFSESKATSLDLSSFDTSNVTNMKSMFVYSQATTLDLSNFNTSKVTDMSGMFYGSQATELDLSNFDTSNVTDMSGMFSGSKATTLDLSNLDTSNVTDMSYMFQDSQATSLDLSNFNTSKVTNMRSMFQASQATTLDLSSFDTSNVTSMDYMFEDSKATELDLSSFDTSNVTDMSFMFYESQATSLDLSSFDTSNVTDMTYMFWDSRATSGFARTQADADRFNNSSDKPSGLTFIVKPQSYKQSLIKAKGE